MTADDQTPHDLAEPPDWLGANGRRMWFKLVNELSATLHDVDQFALEAICGHYDAMRAALQDLHERGPIVPGRGKDNEAISVKNPSAQIARDQSASFKAWVSEFGLTPKSRKALNMSLGEDAEDESDVIG